MIETLVLQVDTCTAPCMASTYFHFETRMREMSVLWSNWSEVMCPDERTYFNENIRKTIN